MESPLYLFVANVFAHHFAWAGGILTVLGVGEMAVGHKLVIPPRWVVRIGVLLLFIACCQAWLDEHKNVMTLVGEKSALASQIFQLSQQPKSLPEVVVVPGNTPTSEPPKFFLNCPYTVMPYSYPASGHIYILIVGEIPSNGLTDYFSAPNSPAKWNNTARPEWAYRCELTNYTGSVAANTTLSLHVIIKEAVPIEGQPNSAGQGKTTLDTTWTVTVPKIDVGPEEAFVFYVWDCCVAKFAIITAPEFAVTGEPSQRRRVPLVQGAGTFSQSLGPFINR